VTEAPTPTFPAPIRATAADLPPAVAEAIRGLRALPEGGERQTIASDGIPFSALSWGPPEGRPVMLLHGVTSSARTFWRVGPALAALGMRVVAVDLRGHGRTGGGEDGHGFGFIDTAREAAAFARAAFADRSDAELTVLGHSWGAMVAAHLPPAGLRPGRIVLLDPPVMDRSILEWMVNDPSSRPDTSPGGALAAIQRENPTWLPGEQIVKAEALTEVVPAAAIAILLGNGDWDAGYAALGDPAAAGIPTWIVRGEDAGGSLTPAAWLPRLAERVGAGHILTVADGPHSPQRTQLKATLVGLLRALWVVPAQAIAESTLLTSDALRSMADD
jgi:pimeloyl-ACP methyl ester carboxylesterase